MIQYIIKKSSFIKLWIKNDIIQIGYRSYDI